MSYNSRKGNGSNQIVILNLQSCKGALEREGIIYPKLLRLLLPLLSKVGSFVSNPIETKCLYNFKVKLQASHSKIRFILF